MRVKEVVLALLLVLAVATLVNALETSDPSTDCYKNAYAETVPHKCCIAECDDASGVLLDGRIDFGCAEIEGIDPFSASTNCTPVQNGHG